MFRVLVHLDRRHVGFLRFLIEGYEGLATTTTVENSDSQSVVELHVPIERSAEFEALLKAVRKQLGISSINQVVV